ncbi:alpha/beta fold hydrolase [Kitasatospora sp. HPMI-4]|uniref:alpha/beta fold hydrolase n=1 Tax=Kitasatospora sp. HPMI-4 TaxID=3448443 RepID=UPI003F19AED0
MTSAALAAPAMGLLGYRRFKQLRNARLMRIDTPNGIDEQGFVRIGGIDQWISIRGEDLGNPVMLEIHGGPGATNSAYGPRTREWERHFTIVRWDMRGTGKTLGRGGADGQGELSFDRLYRDALEVTRHVRARLGVDQVVLVANSFGSVFGLRLARRHPELYSAYVGTDQNILGVGEDSARQALLARLRAAGRHRDVALVERMSPDRTAWTAEQYGAYAKLVVTSDPLTYDTMKTVVVRSLWFSPLHSLRDLRDAFKGMSLSERIVPEVAGFDDRADGTRFELPFFIFQGEGDVFTTPELAKRFLDDVQAPVKDFALIRDAGHFASFRHPERFLELMLTKVRPQLTGRRPAAAR